VCNPTRSGVYTQEVDVAHRIWTMFKKLFFFLAIVGFKLRASHLLGGTLPFALFCVRYFQGRISWTICPSWPQTSILLISASWAARIIGMSHRHLAMSKELWHWVGVQWIHHWCTVVYKIDSYPAIMKIETNNQFLLTAIQQSWRFRPTISFCLQTETLNFNITLQAPQSWP
jgi:hypothetical protein